MAHLPNSAASNNTGAVVANEKSACDAALVGLSPTYWSHVPLCIAQIHSLQLIQGVNCLVLKDGDDVANKPCKLVPISRCRLVACIVAVQRKDSGSAHYVIDDGSGLLDCIAWEDSRDALPSLLVDPAADGSDDNATDCHCQCQVGDVVQIMGRIDCKGVLPDDDDKNNSKDGTGQQCCLRELRVSSIQSLAASPSRRAAPWCLDAESQHMLRSATSDTDGITPLTSNGDAIPSFTSSSLLNANDVLQWLGPEISLQVHQREHFPAVEDALGAWRLFGAQCHCDSVKNRRRLKEELLYCHCIATPEKLDPELKYRDALLDALLDMDAIGAAAMTTVDNSGGTATERKPLFFQFQAIRDNARLATIAEQQILAMERSSIERKQLMLRTIYALRQDGILHLYDADSDTYLLISRANVLEPYMQLLNSKDWEDSVARARLQRNKPAYLQKVPKARFQLIWRYLSSEQDAAMEW